MVQAHPLGITFGLIFLSAISTLFFWMFRVPPLVPLPVVKVHRSVDKIRKVLVPIVEAIPSERAVELACRLGHDQDAEILLVHVIVVPFTLSLSAPMPVQDRVAHDALELGGIIAKRHECRARTRTIRHRNAADGILQVAHQEQVDAIVLGVGVKTRLPGEWGRTSNEILRRAECEVIIDKVPMAVQPIAQAA